MLPKRKSRYKSFILALGISLVNILVLSGTYLWISSNFPNVTTLNLKFQESALLTAQQVCQKYPRIGRDLQPSKSEPTSEENILFKTSLGSEILSLPAKPLPLINERARNARVPVMMYHDILPKKQVFFDVTVQELEEHFQFIKSEQMTPISFNQLIAHLRTGSPLPSKPILLTFDDGYGGHYEYVYPLLKKYGYPAVFSIYTSNIGINTGRSHVTWEQLKTMVADPLVTISGHSQTHPPDLTKLSDEQLYKELVESKKLLEENLGKPINYFTYPSGKSDRRVREQVVKAGYLAALSMDDKKEMFAGESEDLFIIGRFGQSRLKEVIPSAWGGPLLPECGLDFTSSIRKEKKIVDNIPIILISGGKPTTIHAQSRYQVQDIIKSTEAVAAVDGTFFSLKNLKSNVMIGPILTEQGKQFTPGYRGENPKLANRPLVLIGDKTVNFIPFDPDKHNTLEGIQAELNSVTDAFVAAAWLVKDGQPQETKTFGKLYGFDAMRFRAFWGINQAGQPTIGVSTENIDAVSLGKILVKAGLQEAVMLDSGASTSLVYEGKSLVKYVPRDVPHVVALLPPTISTAKK